MKQFILFLLNLTACTGIGGLCFGSAIALWKGLLWLHTGLWRSVDVRSGLLWMGLDPGVTGERGLDQILSWLYGQSFEVALMVSGLAVVALSMQGRDATGQGNATWIPAK